MLAELFRGILLGFFLAALAGPSMLLLIQTSLERGFRQALVFASGIWFSDIMFALLTYFSLSLVVDQMDSAQFRNTLGLVGALILFIFGIASLMKEKNKEKPVLLEEMRKRDVFFIWLKGFAVNTFNPFAIVFWLGVTSDALSRIGTNQSNLWMYIGLILTIITTDILKSLGSDRISKFVNSSWMLYFKKSTGVAMIIFSLVLVYRTFGM